MPRSSPKSQSRSVSPINPPARTSPCVPHSPRPRFVDDRGCCACGAAQPLLKEERTFPTEWLPKYDYDGPQIACEGDGLSRELLKLQALWEVMLERENRAFERYATDMHAEALKTATAYATKFGDELRCKHLRVMGYELPIVTPMTSNLNRSAGRPQNDPEWWKRFHRWRKIETFEMTRYARGSEAIQRRYLALIKKREDARQEKKALMRQCFLNLGQKVRHKVIPVQKLLEDGLIKYYNAGGQPFRVKSEPHCPMCDSPVRARSPPREGVTLSPTNRAVDLMEQEWAEVSRRTNHRTRFFTRKPDAEEKTKLFASNDVAIQTHVSVRRESMADMDVWYCRKPSKKGNDADFTPTSNHTGATRHRADQEGRHPTNMGAGGHRAHNNKEQTAHLVGAASHRADSKDGCSESMGADVGRFDNGLPRRWTLSQFGNYGSNQLADMLMSVPTANDAASPGTKSERTKDRAHSPRHSPGSPANAVA